jgi:membrane fusion protein, copper/silver efflux system
MKKSCTDNKLFAILLVFFLLLACKNEVKHAEHVVADTGISSSVKRISARITSSIPTISAESGTRIFSVEINGAINYDTRKQSTLSSRVSGRIEKLNLKYNFQPVKKGSVIMEIYSPDLAEAEREFLYVLETADDVMINKARQRLELLGMRASDITNLIYEKQILYRIPVYADHAGYIIEKSLIANNSLGSSPVQTKSKDGMGEMDGGAEQSPVTIKAPSNDATPILLREGQYVSAGQPLFTIYHSNGVVAEFALDQQIASHIKRSQKLLLYNSDSRNEMHTATIGLIEPVFRNAQYFSIARVYLDQQKFHVGQLVRANIPVVVSGGWWLPKKSVMQMGTRSIVFKKEKDEFKPVEVQTGAHMKEMIQVLNDIHDWQIASNAYYLVDSESFINENAN